MKKTSRQSLEPIGVGQDTIKNFSSSEYREWLAAVKQRVHTARMKIALAANRELIGFYWDLGEMIAKKQRQSRWGDKIITQLAADLKKEFKDVRGLSSTNIKYCRRFFLFYSEFEDIAADSDISLPKFGQQPVDQIPWGHNIIIFTGSKSLKEANFYIHQTLENGWSREILALQMKNNLYARKGKAITNFSQTLPPPQSDLAQQTLKDPYTFDFVSMTGSFNERDVENQLVNHISNFLLELGKGFVFIARQYHLVIGDSDYYIDLLFYHVILKCYVVIELKNTRFIPEYAGKLNFYLSAVDSLLKQNDDQPTIGLLLCRDKNNIEVEFALRDIAKPLGVSEYRLVETLPDNLKGAMPTVKEIEADLRRLTKNSTNPVGRKMKTNLL